MWRSYFTIAVRALAKDRQFAAINILGLAVGMAACLLILLFVRNERSYDTWLPNAENIYQLKAELHNQNQNVEYWSNVPGPAMATGVVSADQVSALPPLAASNSPTWEKLPAAAVKVKRTASAFCCTPVPVKVTRWRA